MWNSVGGKILITIVISMVPVIELRGAIPIATAHGLNFWVAIVCSIIGNLIPVPFIIIFIRKIFELIRQWSVKLDKLVTKLEDRAQKKSDVVLKYAFWGLVVIVAIPLPGTGAWTGSLVASLFGLPKRSSFLAVTLGVLISGVIMCLASYGVLGFLNFLI